MRKLFVLCILPSLFLFAACSVNETVDSTKQKAEEMKANAIQSAKDSINEKIENTVDNLKHSTEEKIDSHFENIKEDLTF